MIDSFKPAIQALQAQNAPLEESVRPMIEQINANKRLINQLCQAAGVPPLHPEVDQVAKPIGPSRIDEYMGRPLATVVREIMEQRRVMKLGAIHIDDLYEIMVSGGYSFDTKDAAKAKTGMSVSLGKNVVFARVGETQNWGLAEWYPGLKREKKATASSSTGVNVITGTPTPFDVDDDPADPSPPPEPTPAK